MKKALLFLFVSALLSLHAEEFILGMYSADPQTDAVYQTLSDAGFNYVQSYHSYAAESPSRILDLAAKHKMKVMFDIGGKWMAKEKDWPEKLRKLTDAVKDHPALGMWYVWDEPYTGDLAVMAQIIAQIRAVSAIPTTLVIHWRTNWENTRGFTDRWMVDLYPVRGQQFPNAPLEQVNNFIATAARMKLPGTPFIPVLQACDFSCFKGQAPEQYRETLRYPNFTEMRYMSLSSLTYGIHGLFYFSYWHCHTDRPQGKAFFEDSLKPVVREIREFTDIVDKPWEVTGYCYDFNFNNKINIAYWARPKGNFIILTNESREPRDLVLNLKALPNAPLNGDLAPWGKTAATQAILKNGILAIKNAGPWESFIWQVK